MNIFDEFEILMAYLEAYGISYALVGEVAMAFHVELHFTKDIEVLIEATDYPHVKKILGKEGYAESAAPRMFRNVPIALHRFLKAVGGDDMIVDLLASDSEEVRAIIEDALEAESDDGSIRIASRQGLIWLKRKRDSAQDRADIEKLEHGKDR